MKKSQVTVYVIVGIIILVLTGLFIAKINSPKGDILREKDSSQVGLTANTESLLEYRDACIKEAIIDAITLHGCSGTIGPDASCASSTCVGSSCSDSCGNSHSGTKQPDCSCAANTCTDQTCGDGCGGSCPGTKDCSG